jgi:uncharacterized protein (DUF58 family)
LSKSLPFLSDSLETPPMQLNRYMLIRREGLYYLVVLAFILGGAMLREVNPLLMLGGMMVGALVLSWRWGASSLRKVTVEHHLPQHISAGSPIRVGIELSNRQRWFSSWAIWAEDRIERIRSDQSVDPLYSAKASTFVARVNAQSKAQGVYRCLLTRRGRYRFGPLMLTTSFPLGFLRCYQRSANSVQAIVQPQLGSLSKDWLSLLESEGDSREKNRQGRSGWNDGDFYAIRDWRSGDSQRWIHWRTTARLNHLVVRMFERQQSRDYVLLVDLHQPEEPSAVDLHRVEQAVSFAASLASELCRSSSGRLAVVVAGENNEAVHGAASAALLGHVLDQLAVAEATPQVELAEATRMARAEAGSGAPVIVISTRAEHSLPAWIEEEPEAEPVGAMSTENQGSAEPMLSKTIGTFVVTVGSELYDRCFQAPD